ncbi:MAG: amidohydrolase family protein [Bacteroidota bacterium]
MPFLFALAFLLAAFTLPEAPDPDEGRRGTFAITNARIETVTNGVIERGAVVIRDGLIEAVGADVQAPADAEVIDGTGLTVYPGMIDGGTRLGLQEIGSLPETRDFREIGEVTPHMQALAAVNPASTLIPITRVSGVTTVLTAPTGGMMPGTAALISLQGYTPEQLDAGFRGVVLDFPSSARRGWWDRRKPEEIEKQVTEAMETLNETWEQAVLWERIDAAYQAAPEPRPTREYVPEMEALAAVVRREVPFLVEVDAAKDITAAIAWAQEKNVRAVFVGVAEGWRVADELAEAGIPVVAGPVLALPTRNTDRYDRAYANPGLMRDAGVEVALQTAEIENVRNLPYNAAYAAAYGMGRAAALEAVTIVPARIFGVADRLGSIEAGKSATLFVADGDPFETKTQVRHLFIDGYLMPMTSRQTALYDEYLERTPGLAK